MYKIYFDESRNTGEIGFDNGKLNYYNQRYFILAGVIYSEDIFNKYIRFRDNYIHRINSNNSVENEIKGSDLLRRDNNLILEEFFDEFINREDYLLTIYDKKYFLVSQMILWLHGEIFREKEYQMFLLFCELLNKVNDEFLGRYIEVTKINNKDTIIEFIKYIIDYNYRECIGCHFEDDLVLNWKQAITTYIEKSDEYIDLLLEENAENIRLYKKDRNNIVNLTALGETILGFKLNNPEIKNHDIYIYHDEINVVQDYILHYWVDDKLKFISSHNEVGIQLADNISSITGNLVNKLLPILNDENMVEKISKENDWMREKLSRLILKQRGNLKLVMTMREQAAMLTYVQNRTNDIKLFKQQMLKNLDYRFEYEMKNHISLFNAFNILNE